MPRQKNMLARSHAHKFSVLAPFRSDDRRSIEIVHGLWYLPPRCAFPRAVCPRRPVARFRACAEGGGDVVQLAEPEGAASRHGPDRG